MALKQKKDSGFILLEILVAIIIIGLAFAALLSIGTQAINLSSNVRTKTQVDFLIREEIESLRAFRDGTSWATNGLGTVNIGSSYHMQLNDATNPGVWELVAGPEATSSFTRSVVFERVNGDSEIIMATVSVTASSKTYQVATYFTNWK